VSHDFAVCGFDRWNPSILQTIREADSAKEVTIRMAKKRAFVGFLTISNKFRRRLEVP
jgi:hypothetical protein